MPTGPAARTGDFHMCPMVTPGVPPIPHVGGPVLVGMPTVLIGNMPAATMGTMCVCVGPPDSIILGSMGVLIGNKPAARMGDMCAHGGMVAVGFPTVIIGEMSPGGPNPVVVVVAALMSVIQNVMLKEERGEVDMVKAQTARMMAASEMGTAFVHDSCACAECTGVSPRQDNARKVRPLVRDHAGGEDGDALTGRDHPLVRDHAGGEEGDALTGRNHPLVRDHAGGEEGDALAGRDHPLVRDHAGGEKGDALTGRDHPLVRDHAGGEEGDALTGRDHPLVRDHSDGKEGDVNADKDHPSVRDGPVEE